MTDGYMDQSVYKFSKVDKYSLSNLSSGSLCCNHHDVFNDPFECWCIEKYGFPEPDTDPDGFLAVIKSWGFSPARKAEAIEYYKDYAESLEDNQIRIKKWIDRARISSFCADASNLLMWSHYADGLRGFCIEFDRADLLEQAPNGAVLLDVRYEDSPPFFYTSAFAVAWDQIDYHERALAEVGPKSGKWEKAYLEAIAEAKQLIRDYHTKMLATKPLPWMYEREVRLIFDSSVEYPKPEFYQYSATTIKSVTFGERMPHPEREEIRKILGRQNRNVAVKIARRDRASFNLSIE